MKFVAIFYISLILSQPVSGQRKSMLYDEAKVADYSVPDVLTRLKGGKVKSAKDWDKKARPEILNFFTSEVYGKVPGKLGISEIRVWEEDAEALNGLAIRKQLSLFFRKGDLNLEMSVLMYLPKTSGKAPVFLAFNFSGNHTILNDPGIRLTESWVGNDPSVGIINNQVTEQSRGVDSKSWPVEEIIRKGYGLVTVYYGDVDPDKNDFSDGVHPFFYSGSQVKPKFAEWGAIGAWAWGLSRVMDYLETDSQVDARKVAVLGHSALGKAALWAGATDQRFALVVSNESGCGGAALSKRKFGETILSINTSYPHWFSDSFLKYNDSEDLLPADQHMLLALIAPRPLYIASAEKDMRADPKGEFLATRFASPVYELLGKEGLPVREMPELDHPVMGTVGYHIRSGKQDLTLYDWKQFIRFADKHLKGTKE